MASSGYEFAALYTFAPDTGINVVTALVGLAALIAWRRRLAGTTLVGAWYWSLVSWACVAGVELWADARGEPGSIVAWRFAAAMSTFCPAMAVLGARRPQDRFWHFIVLSLWGILSLPSFEWLLFGGPEEIHAARFWFLMVLLAVGGLNGIFTRFWPSSVLFCCGQGALLAPYFGTQSPETSPAHWPTLGLLAIAGSWMLLALGLPRRGRARSGMDVVWLDFRDLFGAVWALRICERMRMSAVMYDWPLTLSWRGFCQRDGHAPARKIPRAVEDSLRTLLRRFVSPAWIDARLSREQPSVTVSTG